MISAVIPLRVTGDGRQALGRLRCLLRQMPEPITPVIADDTPEPDQRAAVARIAARYPRARHVVSDSTACETFSIGRLRDVGTQAAPDPLVLFHDVDFTAPPAFYRGLNTFVQDPGIADDPSNTLCVPVYFLTPKGTRLYRLAPGASWRALRAGCRRGLVDRLVKGSSAILAHRETLLAEGGHDPGFVGHGAEDFELLHRLAKRHPRGPRPANYHVDYGSRATTGEGFRAYFARYGQPPLDAGLALVHLWHAPRREDPRYEGRRRANFERLSAILRRELQV
jgi:predicted glycosyltransferase involved in capsule biosynthesis